MRSTCSIATLLTCGSLLARAQGAAPAMATAQTTLPPAGEVLRVRATCGAVGGQVVVSVGSPEAVRLTLAGVDCPAQNKDYSMTKIPKEVHLRDGAITAAFKNGPRFTYYLRPNPRFYVGKEFEAALQQWDQRPAASEHVFTLLARRQAEGVEWWLDGRYLTVTPLAADQSAIAITVSGGGALAETGAAPDPLAGSARLLPLDLAGYRLHRGALPVEALQVAREALRAQRLEGADSAARLDVGLSRWLEQSTDPGGFYDRYYMRGAFDGVPESLVLRVPKRHYTRAWVLCAVAPGESPWMTVRIGRYRETWDGSGMSVGDTHVKIDPQEPEGLQELRPVGTVRLGTNGVAEVPLFLAAVPLATDQIADYLQWEGLDPARQDFGVPLDWLNLEFSRRIEPRLTLNSGIFDAKPVGPRSGVQILGVTLQCEPVQVLVKSEEPGFSFSLDRKPRLLLETRNLTGTAQAVTLQARIADVDGRVVSRRLDFKAEPGTTATPWRLDDLPPGWYDAELVFGGVAAGEVWSQKASMNFALLLPDERRAGDESPYGTWWFQGSHYTDPDPARVLPLFHKMGFRHCPPGVKPEPSLFQKYQVTPSMMGYMSKVTPTNTLPMQAFMTNWPSVKTAMIFHETGIKGLSTALPHELTGLPPEPFTDEQRAQLDTLRAKIEEQAAAIRTLDPEMKIMVGNGSTAFNTLWFREKLPTRLWDYCGLEMGIQTLHPESQPTGWNSQSFWIARQMAEVHGYTNFPISTCFEVGYRSTGPGGLSFKRQADWYARDVLHMLAWRSPHINVALIIDVNASYFTSRWGATGVFQRSPLHLPKPAFVSLATLTLMLDGAVYQRAVPTGSTGVYCLEFRKGRDQVYALWCSRGSRPVELAIEGGPGRSVDSMGRDLGLRYRRGRVSVPATESPCYVTARRPVTGVALGAPAHETVSLAEPQVVDALRGTATWRLVEEGDEAFGNYCRYWPMVKGDIVAEETAGAQADDAAGGIRLTLRPQPGVRDIVGRYAVLEPVAGPRPIAGRPDTLGVWVNGNSGWGRLFFEFTDALGRRWISNRGEGDDWDLSDWEGETSINHDGWRLVSLPLPACYPSGYYKPSMRHWRCIGKDGAAAEGQTSEPAWPIALSRLYVLMREKLVYVTEMTPPASPSIELRDITAGTRRD